MRRQQFPEIFVKPGFCLCFAVMLLLLPFEWVFGWFISVTIHEFGHFISLRLLLIRIHSVSLDYHGVFMRTEPMNPMQEIICALSGPLLGVCLLPFAQIIPHAAVCAFMLSLFNLLPCYPLDGGRVLNGILLLLFEPATAMLISKCVGFLTQFLLFTVMLFIAVRYNAVLPIASFVLLLMFKNKPEKYLANKVL